jgi:hypothetical protein
MGAITSSPSAADEQQRKWRTEWFLFPPYQRQKKRVERLVVNQPSTWRVLPSKPTYLSDLVNQDGTKKQTAQDKQRRKRSLHHKLAVIDQDMIRTVFDQVNQLLVNSTPKIQQTSTPTPTILQKVESILDRCTVFNIYKYIQNSKEIREWHVWLTQPFDANFFMLPFMVPELYDKFGFLKNRFGDRYDQLHKYLQYLMKMMQRLDMNSNYTVFSIYMYIIQREEWNAWLTRRFDADYPMVPVSVSQLYAKFPFLENQFGERYDQLHEYLQYLMTHRWDPNYKKRTTRAQQHHQQPPRNTLL